MLSGAFYSSDVLLSHLAAAIASHIIVILISALKHSPFDPQREIRAAFGLPTTGAGTKSGPNQKVTQIGRNKPMLMVSDRIRRAVMEPIDVPISLGGGDIAW